MPSSGIESGTVSFASGTFPEASRSCGSGGADGERQPLACRPFNDAAA